MPTSNPNARFASIISRRAVEQKIIALLVEWIPTYIAELERQEGLAPASIPLPPDPSLSYLGGVDWEIWEQSWSPQWTVIVKPAGPPERVSGAGIYHQVFNVQVGVNFVMPADAPSLGPIEEDSARQYADLLGMAGCAAIMQHGGIGRWPDGTTVSAKTVLTAFPDTSYPYPEERRTARCVFAVQMIVTNALTEAAGPSTPPANPYASPIDWPIVVTTGPVVEAVPLSEQIPPGED